MPEPTDILDTHGAKDQVILPLSVAFGLCMRGIKVRLGRSVVTLLGITLGIAFLASVLSGMHVKEMLRGEEQIVRQIDLRVSLLGGELGRLKDKTILVYSQSPTRIDNDTVRRLQETAKARLIFPKGPKDATMAADGALLLGQAEPLLKERAADLKDTLVIIYSTPSKEAAEEAKAAGLKLKHLGVELSDEYKAKIKSEQEQEQKRTYWIIVVSLLITVISITNAMLMSVTERFREIGTMKCLGAMSSFVVKVFVIETSLMGMVGAASGALLGTAFTLLAYANSFSFATVFSAVSGKTLLLYGLGSVLAGLFLSMIAGIYPARVAAKMRPAVALSSHV